MFYLEILVRKKHKQLLQKELKIGYLLLNIMIIGKNIFLMEVRKIGLIIIKGISL